MASAMKCDRCGNYYDKNKGVHSVNGCIVRGIRIDTSGPYKILDLCDPCISELYTFLGLNKEKEEENE